MVGFRVWHDLQIRASLANCLVIGQKKHSTWEEAPGPPKSSEWPFLTVEKIPSGFQLVRPEKKRTSSDPLGVFTRSPHASSLIPCRSEKVYVVIGFML